MSWGWLLGYKFLVAELSQVGTEADETEGGEADGGQDAGAADAGTPDAASPPTAAVGYGLLHLGSTACSGNPGLGEVSCARPNRVHAHLDVFDAATQAVTVDVASLFSEVNLRRDVQCHSGDELCAPLFNGLGLTFPGGLPDEGQRLFRVE
jgi:hypothetical protein